MKFEFFFGKFLKSPEIYAFLKIRRVVCEFLDKDSKTEMSKLIVAFRKLAKAPKRVNK